MIPEEKQTLLTNLTLYIVGDCTVEDRMDSRYKTNAEHTWSFVADRTHHRLFSFPRHLLSWIGFWVAASLVAVLQI